MKWILVMFYEWNFIFVMIDDDVIVDIMVEFLCNFWIGNSFE